MHTGFQEEQKRLIEQEKEAKRQAMLARLRQQAQREDERLEMVKQKSAASNKPEEEAKVPASDASALDPARQSYSEGFMKSIDRKALA